LAFIVFSAVGGWAWGKYGPEAILWLLVACAALNAGMQLFLPKLDRSDEGNPGVTTSDDPHGYAGLLRRVDFRLLLVSATLLQASHAMFYGFGSNHLYAEGLSQDVIAALWNEGVVAEIVLFSFGAQIVTRWSPTGLLVIAGLGGLIRWTIFALTSSIGWLVVAQLFHAATFAAMHLGAMAFIRTYIVGTESARATTLHGAIAYGLAFGLGWPVAGHLYSTYGKLGFLAMTSCSALGLLAALWLRRIERAGRL
jgi:PPP family 3-phenylpropionic acid transporter